MMRYKTKKYTSYLPVFLFLIIFSVPSLAQKSNDLISIENLNRAYLEHLIKIKIDSVRNQLGLSTLVNDSILYIAADYHANWLEENNAFSHSERGNENHETPQERVDFYGVKNYYVGENIIKSYINKPLKSKKGRKTYINKTYGNLANDFVVGWVNSPGHYANIITERYNKTGLAISINKDKKLVYGVQKFATVLYEYEVNENKNFFKYSETKEIPKITSFDEVEKVKLPRKFVWKIKADSANSKLCLPCNEALNTRKYRDYLKRKGKGLNLKSYNVKAFKKVFKKAKSGLAVEEVEYLAYDCGNPEYYTKASRRNGNHIFNGRVYEPVYNKELKKAFIGKKNPYLRKRLARITKGSFGYVEHNVLVLQKNKLCRVLHFSDYCGEQYFPKTNIHLKDTLIIFEYEIPRVTDTFEFKIPFKKNQYDFEMEEIKPLLGAFKNTDFEIISADILAFSSLEGNEKLNKALQEKRALSLLKVFQNNQEKEIQYSINTASNWTLFHKQIIEAEALKMLKNLSDEEILDSLKNKNFLNKIESFLEEQRYGQISLEVTYFQNTDQISKEYLRELKKHFDKNKSIKLSLADSIYKMMYKLYEIDKKNKDFSNLKQLQIIVPKGSTFHEYTLDALFNLGYFQEEKTLADYNMELRKLYFPSYHSLLNRLSFSVQNLNNETNLTKDLVELAFADIDSIRSKISLEDKLKFDSLEFQFYNASLNYFFKEEGEDFVVKSSKRYANLLSNKAFYMKLSDEELFKIAKQLVFFESDLNGFLILEKLIQKETKIEAVYVLHAKMAYRHNKEFQKNYYHDYLIKLNAMIENKTWCEMFVGPCNISFQVFDYEPLRNLYCEKCSEYKNYANQ